MAHIHTGPGQHDHTVSAYILRVDGPQPMLLLHRHKTLNRYLQFGGHIELEENPWQAITHEILEESGYALDQLELLLPPERVRTISGSVLHPVPLCYNTHRITDSHFHSDTSWAFITDSGPLHSVGDDESTDIEAFSASDLSDGRIVDIDASSRDIAAFIFEVCLPNWDRVRASAWTM